MEGKALRILVDSQLDSFRLVAARRMQDARAGRRCDRARAPATCRQGDRLLETKSIYTNFNMEFLISHGAFKSCPPRNMFSNAKMLVALPFSNYVKDGREKETDESPTFSNGACMSLGK